MTRRSRGIPLVPLPLVPALPHATSRPTRTRIPSFVLVAVAALVVACGDAEVTPADPGTEERQPAAVAAAAEEFTYRSPATLDAYRYSWQIELAREALASRSSGGDSGAELRISGSIITPDRRQTVALLRLGAERVETESIRIGQERWARESSGEWRLEPPSAQLPGLADFSALMPDGVFPAEGVDLVNERLADLERSEERVDGHAAYRYDFTYDEFTEIFGERAYASPSIELPKFDVALWLSRELGVPLRMEIEAHGRDGAVLMQGVLELSEFNSPTIEIKPPR